MREKASSLAVSAHHSAQASGIAAGVRSIGALMLYFAPVAISNFDSSHHGRMKASRPESAREGFFESIASKNTYSFFAKCC